VLQLAARLTNSLLIRRAQQPEVEVGHTREWSVTTIIESTNSYLQPFREELTINSFMFFSLVSLDKSLLFF